MRVFLVPKATGKNYSIEAGLADNVKHFDHHGEYSSYPAPSNNTEIPRLGPNDIVEITHVDADTLLGLFRMSGLPMPELDYDLIEKVDVNGSSVVENRMNDSYSFMVGVNSIAKDIGFPRTEKEPQEVTDKIKKMLRIPVANYIKVGKEATRQAEQTLKNNLVSKEGKVGLWAVGKEDSFDPSRPYDDGYACVVVYRKHFKSISIYCAPSNDYQFGNNNVAGIHFAGHPKACGSPRGEDFSLEDAKKVFDEVANSVNSKDTTASSKTLPDKIMYKGHVYNKAK